MTNAAACLLLASSLAFPENLAVGRILVASRKSHDADFAQTVVLLVRHDQQTAIGLFLNRPLNILVSEVYPEFKGKQLKLYAGGPVTIGIQALYRSRTKPPEASRVFADVSMISNKTLLGKMVEAGAEAGVVRMYAGYAGWSPGQLQDEIAHGLWHVIAGDASVVFDPHPETLWSRLIGHASSLQNSEHVGEVVRPRPEASVGF